MRQKLIPHARQGGLLGVCTGLGPDRNRWERWTEIRDKFRSGPDFFFQTKNLFILLEYIYKLYTLNINKYN